MKQPIPRPKTAEGHIGNQSVPATASIGTWLCSIWAICRGKPKIGIRQITVCVDTGETEWCKPLVIRASRLRTLGKLGNYRRGGVDRMLSSSGPPNGRYGVGEQPPLMKPPLTWLRIMRGRPEICRNWWSASARIVRSRPAPRAWDDDETIGNQRSAGAERCVLTAHSLVTRFSG